MCATHAARYTRVSEIDILDRFSHGPHLGEDISAYVVDLRGMIAQIGRPLPDTVAELGLPQPVLAIWLRHVG